MFQLWGQSGRVSRVKSSQVGPVVNEVKFCVNVEISAIGE